MGWIQHSAAGREDVSRQSPARPFLAPAKRRWSMTPAQRHSELVREIDAHSYRYYVLDDPVVGDADFDRLLRELRAIEADHPELATADSPTRRVGGESRTTVVQVRRAERMLSLDNAYSDDEMREF